MSILAINKKVQVWIFGRTQKEGLRVLLLRTLPSRDAFWQPVTGGVDDGESFEQAAFREAAEETGLRFKGPVIAIDFEFEYEGRWGKTQEKVYMVEAEIKNFDPKQIQIDPHEHDRAEWVTPDQAQFRLKFVANVESLRRALRIFEEARLG